MFQGVPVQPELVGPNTCLETWLPSTMVTEKKYCFKCVPSVVPMFGKQWCICKEQSELQELLILCTDLLAEMNQRAANLRSSGLWAL